MSLFEGLALGLAYAMPIGTQNIFVIQSALNSGIPRAYVTAGTVALMDITLSLSCFYGVGVLLEAAPSLKNALMGLGALYLLRTGWPLLGKQKLVALATADATHSVSVRRIIAMAFILTWLNPSALIDGSLLLGGYRSSLPSEEVQSFVTGMASASVLWCFSLTSLIGALREKMPSQALHVIQRLCGALLLFLGIKMAMGFVTAMTYPGILSLGNALSQFATQFFFVTANSVNNPFWEFLTRG